MLPNIVHLLAQPADMPFSSQSQHQQQHFSPTEQVSSMVIGTRSLCTPLVLLPLPSLLALSPAAAPSSPQQESTFRKFLVSGTVAWIYEFSIGHFLEFTKVLKQTKQGSYLQLVQGIMREKGVVGVWDGFFPWGSIQAIAKGAVFGGAHALALGPVAPLVERGELSPLVAETMAGGIAGGFQGMVLSPTLLLKTRVMTDPIFRERMSMWETSKQSARVGFKVIQKEGLAALMKGSLTFSLKRVADWGTRFYFAVISEDYLFKKGDATYVLSNHEKLAASLIGGGLSSLLTLPLDVMVAQIQQASKAGQQVSVLATFQAEFKQGGWERVAGFATKGFVARTLHVALTTALMKTLTSVVYEKIYGCPTPQPAKS
ncbi:mitochondrial carrier family [Nannochloropsis oceanica]